MKMYRTRVNPAFKQTQLLPVLPADFAGRAGRAAMTFSKWVLLQRASPANKNVAGPVAILRPDFNAPALRLMA